MKRLLIGESPQLKAFKAGTIKLCTRHCAEAPHCDQVNQLIGWAKHDHQIPSMLAPMCLLLGASSLPAVNALPCLLTQMNGLAALSIIVAMQCDQKGAEGGSTPSVSPGQRE